MDTRLICWLVGSVAREIFVQRQRGEYQLATEEMRGKHQKELEEIQNKHKNEIEKFRQDSENNRFDKRLAHENKLEEYRRLTNLIWGEAEIRVKHYISSIKP